MMNVVVISLVMGKEEDRFVLFGGGGVGEIGVLEGVGGDLIVEVVVMVSFIFFVVVL